MPIYFEPPSVPGEPGRALVDHDIPSAVDFARMRDERLAVVVYRMPIGLRDLAFLEPVFDVVPGLVVQDPGCRDARAVERMPELRWLDLGSADLRHPVDLGGAQLLNRLRGDWKYLESLVECTALTDLTLDHAESVGLAGLKSSLTKLTLNLSSRLSEVPEIRASRDLRVLRIHGSSRLDLAGIRAYPNLEWLTLDGCRSIGDSVALLGLREDCHVELFNCPFIDDWMLLEPLKVATVRVAEKNPFDVQFREAVASSERWIFPTVRSLIPPPRGTGASRQEYLIHPAIDTPFRIPQDRLDDFVSEEFPESWIELDLAAQFGRLRSLLSEVIEWARTNGADTVVWLVPPFDEDDTRTVSLGPESERELLGRIDNLSGVRILAGDTLLATVDDSIEDGIHVFADGDLPRFGSGF